MSDNDRQMIDRDGVFQGRIIEYGLSEMESGAVCVNVMAKISAQFDFHSKSFVDWTNYTDVFARGAIWIVNKKGEVLDKAVKSMVDFAGWDGSLESIANETWQPEPCQFSIQPETDKDGREKAGEYRIAFLNDYDRVPGSMSNIKPEQVGTLSAKYGGQFRALAGRQPAKASTNKPTTQPQRPANGKPAPAKPVTAVVKNDDGEGDIPF